jgi:hypothetical protein
MTENREKIWIDETKILDIILILREPNTLEELNQENLPTWEVEVNDYIDITGDRSIIEAAISRRFSDLGASSVRESALVRLREFL